MSDTNPGYNPNVGHIPRYPSRGLPKFSQHEKEQMFKQNEYEKAWMDEATAFTLPQTGKPTPAMMVMDLIVKIGSAEHLFIETTGKKPTHIYLGQSEKEILLSECIKMYKAGDEKRTQKEICKSQLAGMELHFVEDESYFKMF